MIYYLSYVIHGGLPQVFHMIDLTRQIEESVGDITIENTLMQTCEVRWNEKSYIDIQLQITQMHTELQPGLTFHP
jgi:hypothetical protein